MKEYKAPGEDLIPHEFYKYCSDDFAKHLLANLNDLYENDIVPTCFESSVILPVYKKGNQNMVENYRGISLINTIRKIFGSMLYRRLINWAEEQQILIECQAGFRQGYSAVDQIYTLSTIVDIYREEGKNIYAYFVDFKSAFDTVDRDLMFYKLSALGLPFKMLRTLRIIYKNCSAKVWDGVNMSESFATPSGLRQGCILCTLLFALFINDIVSYINGGFDVGRTKIKVLMYADDIVLLADTPIKLQMMITKFEEFCKLWNLTVNRGKSQIMIFGRGKRQRSGNYIWKLEREAVEVVDNYKYLGVILTPQNSIKTHLLEKLKSAKIAIKTTWLTCIKIRAQDFESNIKSLRQQRDQLCFMQRKFGDIYNMRV
ncbi:uncharacterized protein LOC129946057 [Eupeodes corollae]|uniref:uncharacterized protein LOC129946057 n=1 Tax=Eupeodes corollae TaxID=290404 RepID=UPI00248FF3A9|nr:uncharacterized protein LOC129946057 [Eupeodes corollae]